MSCERVAAEDGNLQLYLNFCRLNLISWARVAASWPLVGTGCGGCGLKGEAKKGREREDLKV